MTTPRSPLSRAFDVVVPGPAVGAAELVACDFAASGITALRHTVRDRARASGLTDDALDDFVIAVHELVVNAVRHGGGRGFLRLRRDGDTLICDVTDHGAGFPGGVPAPAGPPAADVPGGRGILLARQLSDTLMFSDGPEGVTATVTACLPAATAPLTVASAPVEAAEPG